MPSKYCCPNCKTNKTRFNLIEQIVHAVKKDPQSGEVIQEYNHDQLEPFHLAYNGPELRVQCAACGLIEAEKTFVAYGDIT
ncbi:MULTISPECIES: hypothetical protein [Bacillus]|uniref:hypothetical protein n=1 Tax=Bacillus TaxID=1386 RepID=UPI0002F57268|nr:MULTISPECIES: hypothetical protein [Bacillus]